MNFMRLRVKKIMKQFFHLAMTYVIHRTSIGNLKKGHLIPSTFYAHRGDSSCDGAIKCNSLIHSSLYMAAFLGTCQACFRTYPPLHLSFVPSKKCLHLGLLCQRLFPSLHLSFGEAMGGCSRRSSTGHPLGASQVMPRIYAHRL